MSALEWSNPNPRYESGVDHGVLYPETGPGVVWNGLISVDESYVGGETEPLHFDGIKYMDQSSYRDYQASVSAFSAPAEFGPSVGDFHLTPGFILTRQPRTRFGMSYRTLIGNDLGYKIHLIYNAMATPSGKGHKTVGESVSPTELSWTIDAVPVRLQGLKPSAHFVLDSTKIDPAAMEAVEQWLYGTDESEPELPDIEYIHQFVSFYLPMGVVEEPVGGISDLVVGGDDLTGTSIAGIFIQLATTDLVESDIAGLYTLET